MSNMELMSRAVDFIEAHLQEPVTVADIADAVSFSLYHFCRTFNEATHHTPYDYLMRRRLSESARELLRTDKKVIEIACDYQFNNPETFSRAFRRMFGMQPNQLRKQGSVDGWRVMPRLTLAHLQHIAQGAYLKPVLEEKGTLRVAGMMTLVKLDQTVISDLWELFAQELQKDSNLAEPRTFYGIAYYPRDWENRGFLYMAGVELQERDIVSAAWVVRTIPPLKYARFVHKGPARDLQLTLDYIYHTWLPRSGKNLSSSWLMEHYGGDFRDSEQESESKIYIPIED
jgi:AraC family transcriptional regulator